ncbi:hypothetical protein [Catenulispora rubra]|uniref:hypothetical protein n=1 Tax=Catenulispora rubra TaxID=280293 RepID=UPI0018920271|nr:hypothetical protein [Catenulispora rubra]
MKFMQIIDFETERMDEMTELMRQFEAASRASGRAEHPTYRTVLRDRANPDRYVVVVEFDSYEEAMANSSHPDTTAFSQKMAGLVSRPPVFTDCDILEQSEIKW